MKKQIYPARCRILFFSLIAFSSFQAIAQTLYWDTNQATAGSGNVGGSWNSGTNWSTNANGTTATTGWVDGRSVVFSAGTDGAGTWTVTITGTVATPSIEFQEGAATTITGGNINVAGGLAITNINQSAGGADNIQSKLTGTGNITIAANGNVNSGGNLTRLSGDNDFVGSLTITRGVVQIYNSDASKAQTALGNANNTIILNGGGLMNENQSFTLAATRSIQLGVNNGTLRGWGETTMTVDSVISGVGRLIKTNTGTIILNGTNTYEGGTTVSAGVLRAAKDASLGVNTGGLTLDGGILMNQDAALDLNASRTVTLTSRGGGFRAGWGGEPDKGRVTVNGKITGAGDLRVQNDGGAVILANTTNDYTGTTTIGGTGSGQTATLRLGVSDVLPNSTDLQFDAGTTGVATFDMNGKNETIAGLVSLTGNGIVTNTTSTASTLTVDIQTGSVSYTGAINNGTSSVALIKSGAGTQILSGASTYSGGTTVSAGTLLANNTTGSATGTGSVSIASGASLGGTGSITGGNSASINLNSGMLLIGNTHGAAGSAQKLQLGDLSLNVAINLNGNLQFDLFGAGSTIAIGDNSYNAQSSANDLLKILTLGSLNLDNAKIELASVDTSTWQNGQSWKLIDWTDITPSNVSALNVALLTTNLGGFTLTQTLVNSGAGAGYYITASSVPEPSRFVLLLGAFAYLFARRKRGELF